METNKQSLEEKIEKLKGILNYLDETQIDALLTLLESRIIKPYAIPESEVLLAAESYERYGRGETKGISAKESVRKLTEHLKKIKHKK